MGQKNGVPLRDPADILKTVRRPLSDGACVRNLSVMFFHGSGDVHHGQEHEDQGLDERDQELQDEDG